MSIVLNISEEFAGLVRGLHEAAAELVDVGLTAPHPAVSVTKMMAVAAVKTDRRIYIRTLPPLRLRPEVEAESTVAAGIGGRPWLMPTIDVERTADGAAARCDADT